MDCGASKTNQGSYGAETEYAYSLTSPSAIN